MNRLDTMQNRLKHLWSLVWLARSQSEVQTRRAEALSFYREVKKQMTLLGVR